MPDAVTVDTLAAGDHACMTFSDPDERLDLLAEFVAAGLESGQKVVCFTGADARSLPRELLAHGVNVEMSLQAGQFQLISWQESWLGSDSASAAATLELLSGQLSGLAEYGWAGLRVAADMCWVTEPAAAAFAPELLVFERQAAGLFTSGLVTAICQYDRDQFDAVTLATVTGLHSKTVAAAVYHDTALLRICRQHRPPGVRIAGELDYSAMEPLQLALAEAMRLDHDIHLNLSKLQFIDLTCATAIIKTALALPADRQMRVLCNQATGHVFKLTGANDVPALRVSAFDEQA